MPVKDPGEVYTVNENPKHIQAMKDGKAPLEYLVDFVMTGDAYVHKGGADKYGFRNWTIDSIKASTYIAAIRRHLKAWSEGEDLDPDSGWSHMYHIRAGCAIVLDADNVGKLIDDRDRAESISQEKETEGTTAAPDREHFFMVQYSLTQKNENNFPLAYTKSFGPFDSHSDALEFILGNAGKTPGVSSIHKVHIV